MRIFKNGQFISCEDESREFSVLIEDNGKIIYTGDEIPQAYESAKMTDLKGRCVVPVFSDTHMHFESYALFKSTVDVRDCRNFVEMGELLNSYIENHPETKFLPAYGCSAHTVAEGRLPEKADLDKLVSLPLLIVKYDGHAAVANSALIDQFPEEVTNDPGFSSDTGWLYQNAFYKGVNFITEKVPPLNVLSGMYKAAGDLAGSGVGYIHTVEGVGYKNDIDIDTIRLAQRGLPNHFKVFFQTMDVDKVLKRKMKGIGGCFSLALDGCFGSEDAALSEGYTNNPENKGFLAYTQEEVNDFCIKANRAGLQITMHAIGDVAVEQALNAYEAALNDTPRDDHRHILIHADLISDHLQKKAAALGIYIAVQPAFLDWRQEPESYLTSILGERAMQILPLRSMIDHGIVLSAGSDAPCTIPDPVASIYLCCNHPNPEESITPMEALKMHTLWAAKTGFDEDLHGSLTVGKYADFVVLDKNPLKIPVQEIKNIRLLATYLQGHRFNKNQSYGIGKLLCKIVIGK